MDFEERLEVEIQIAQQDDIDTSGIWELFESATPQQRVTVFFRTLETGVLNDEYAFEFLNTIRSDCDPGSPEDRALYTDLLNRFREREPKLYRQSSVHYNRYLINFAIIEGRWGDLSALLTPYTSAYYLDLFNMVIAQLEYHGQIRPLIAAMELAWPNIKASSKIFEWAREEFAGELMELMLVDYLENATDPRPDDPQLIETTAFLLSWEENWLAWFIPAVMRPRPGGWNPADFSEDIGSEAWMNQFNVLQVEFIGIQWRNGIPLTRGLLAWHKWSEIFHAQTKTLQKSRKKTGKPELSRLLIPQPNYVEKILGESFSLIGGEPHEATAALEFIPSYLNFLEDLGLIQATERHLAIQKIRPMVEQMPRIMEYYEGDPVAIENLLDAWEMKDHTIGSS